MDKWIDGYGCYLIAEYLSNRNRTPDERKMK